ncbi:hypothetical protein N656DRAFT_223561 [Canariomyces notabilis]|uniref:Mg2+ transporter protein, CorA-like/Zinc transport protein ZntB n=1 Tax=Canariomyces notabilis TaxID=2074819 RepID=A0AAN6YWH2_9PEZI|nr:hypothetical protein N656DRAFT_223561 [Canariomyces arenarius]
MDEPTSDQSTAREIKASGFGRNFSLEDVFKLTYYRFTPEVVKLEILKDGTVRTFASSFSELYWPRDTCTSETAALVFAIEGDEGLKQRLELWIKKDDPWTRRDFVQGHFEGDEHVRRELEWKADNVFFANWWQAVAQKTAEHEIQQLVSSGRPFNVSTFDDPFKLRVDHTRYSPWPLSPHRPYHLLSISSDEKGKKTRFCAAQQCLSYYRYSESGKQADISMGVILVDPVRRFHVLDFKWSAWRLDGNLEERVIPCFIQDVPKVESDTGGDHGNHHGIMVSGNTATPYFEARPLDRLIRALKQAANCDTILNPERIVKTAMIEIACEDLSLVVKSISRALDDIELSLHKDAVLQESMSQWREQLGRWQNIFVHQSLSLQRMSKILPLLGSCSESERLEKTLARLETDVEWISRRTQTTFQSAMSSIAIVESARAIKEAESVAKLTQLAFFFIPLSLVAGAFGMNIKEFEEQLTWWHWVAVSAGTSAVTYCALYRSELASNLYQLPSLFESVRKAGIHRFMSRWIRIIRYVMRPFTDEMFGKMWLGLGWGVFLGVIAALCVGTWKLAVSDLSVGAKVSISIFAIWLPGVPLALYLMIFVDCLPCILCLCCMGRRRKPKGENP